jgi:hypothetical protein
MATMTITIVSPESTASLTERAGFTTADNQQNCLNLVNYLAGLANGSQDMTSIAVNVA